MAIVTIPNWGLGLNADAAPQELPPGYCTDCTNFRFRNGFAEQVGGISISVFGLGGPAPSVIPYWIGLYASSLSTLGNFIIHAGIAKVYANDFSGVETDITRYTTGADITSITFVGTTATVTTATNHGRTTGDIVTHYAALPTDYNATGAITVTGATTYTYTMATTPATNATTVGMYSYNSTPGAAISTITNAGTTATVTTATPHGRATGNSVTHSGATPAAYNGTFTITVTGASTYTYVMASDPGGNASVVGTYIYNAYSSFTGAIDDRWSGGSLNGIFFLNNPVDGLYYWNGDVATKLRKMPLATTTNVARSFLNYIFQLENYTVRHSSAAAPGAIPSAFTAAVGNDANRTSLAATQGKLVDCLPLGDALIIYAEDARYAGRWTGDSRVFVYPKMPGTDGLLARGCVVDTPKGHVFLSQNFEVLIHSGGECVSLSAGRIASKLALATASYRKRSFLMTNPRFHEVWVCIPTGTSQVPDTAWIWNWKDDTWGHKTLPDVSYGTSGLVRNNLIEQYAMVCSTSLKIGAVDYVFGADSTNNFGTGYNSTIIRTGLTLGKEWTIKNLSRSFWSLTGTAATAPTTSIYHGSSMQASAAPTYTSAITLTYGTTKWTDGIATGGQYLALKAVIASPLASGYALKFKTVHIDVSEGGQA